LFLLDRPTNPGTIGLPVGIPSSLHLTPTVHRAALESFDLEA
jgi:hypothetical protein